MSLVDKNPAPMPVRAGATEQLLRKADPYFGSAEIRCWEMPAGKINIYCFSMAVPDEATLMATYKEARDHIAVTFQGQTLEDNAERWNLYLFYFVSGPVSRGAKQQIEQDKFSTRKSVISGYSKNIKDDFIAKTIFEELFQFDFQKRKKPLNHLDTLLKQEHPLVFQALQQLIGADTREALVPLLKILNDE
jgi:hypothetical protein